MKSTPHTSSPMAFAARIAHLLVVGMHDVGEVDGGAARGEVAGAAQVEDLAGGEHGVARGALVGHEALGLGVELDAREHLLVADAAARIAVHDRHELGDGALAVAHDVPGHALGHRHQLAADDEHAVVEPGEEVLDDHAAGVLAGLLEGGAHLVSGLQIERDAATVVRVERLDDDRIPEALGSGGGGLGGAHHALARHGQAELAEDAVRLLLVGGDLDRDVARLRGDGGLDALLVLAVTELHEAVVVEAHPGDVAGLGGADERAGGGPELTALREVDELPRARS